MKLLYGTANPAKLKSMREMLEGLNLEILGLNDIDIQVNHIEESGNNPLQNARIKALEYYKTVKIPVFSCDSGLYIEGINSEDQPGVHVRRVKGKVLSDEEMIEHYTKLALKSGGELKARYKNAICLILDEKNIFQYDGNDIASNSFIITSRPHVKRNIGFPLDSISVDLETKKYYMDLELEDSYKDREEMEKGFKSFFIRSIDKRLK